jgi:hypothetical protein
VTGVIHEDIMLPGGQWISETKIRVTYPLEVSVDHITGVEVAETLSDVGQLIITIRRDKHNQSDAYKSKAVYVGLLDIIQQIAPGHPI